MNSNGQTFLIDFGPSISDATTDQRETIRTYQFHIVTAAVQRIQLQVF